MRLNGTNCASKFEGIKGRQVLALEQNGRDDLIGALIIRAVLDGLIAYTNATDATLIAPFCWKVGHLEQSDIEATNGGIDIVPELGITKRYSGSWRHQS